MAEIKRFRAVLETDDGSSAFAKIPFDVKVVFGKTRPAVRVTLNGYKFRSTLVPYGDTQYLGVNHKVRAAAGVNIGDQVEVILEADDAPRMIEPPADLARALQANPAAQARWAQLSYSHQKEYVEAIEEAKKSKTRVRRIAQAIDRLAGEHHTRSERA